MTQIATVERILGPNYAEISVPRKSACGHVGREVTVYRPYSAKFDLQALYREACYCERGEQ